MDRKTTIIDDAAGLQLGKSQQKKGKGKAKPAQKSGGGSAALAPQSTGITKPKALRKTKTVAAPAVQFYEENGIKINLFEESGRKRKHARLARVLRKKSEDELLAIVETYAGSTKSQEFKRANARKLDIAEWIEAKETLALGPHPQSKLVTGEFEVDHLGTNSGLTGELKEDETESSVANQANESPVVIEPSRGMKRPSPDEKTLIQPPSKQQKRVETAEPKPVRRIKLASPSKKQAVGTSKPDGAKTPTHPQQTSESPKKMGTLGRITNTNISASKYQKDTPSKKENTESTPRIDMPVLEAPKISHEAIQASPIQRRTATQTEEEFMASINLDPSHPFTATKTIQLHAQLEHRILTAYQRDAACPPPPSFHSTSIPHDYRADNNPCFRPAPPSFLKSGRHGPCGDFMEDADRVTGRGHGYDPEDAREYQEYMIFRRKFYKRWPTYPRLRPGEMVEEEILRAWQEWRVWYTGFVRKYPGRRGDQWVCGCSKEVEGEMDWEEGDSEEE